MLPPLVFRSVVTCLGTNTLNDILSKSLISRNNIDFTKNMLNILEENGNFIEYQNTQNNKIVNIEDNMTILMNKYNL